MFDCYFTPLLDNNEIHPQLSDQLESAGGDYFKHAIISGLCYDWTVIAVLC
jgi:hypothetical protein